MTNNIFEKIISRFEISLNKNPQFKSEDFFVNI
jgi:hypothetical protein